jgi:succinate dehydrogenase / fumarate reductase, cytochrome b subunit
MWLINSSVGRKVIMSVTGIALVLFLTFHMAMNLVAIFSERGYNEVCAFLGANWYALVGTLALAALFVIHIFYAFCLTLMNRKARGSERYAVTDRPKTVEWASQNMLVLGLIVVVGLGLHFCNYWYHMQFAEITHDMVLAPGGDPSDGITLMKQTFGSPIYALIYLIWLCALWFHLTHGFWSSMQTLGWNNQKWVTRWKCISNIYTTILILGFVLVIITFFVKVHFCGATI